MSHIENGRYWAAQALARRNAGDVEGFRACLSNAQVYADRAIDEVNDEIRKSEATRKQRERNAVSA
jgi:hypothetical protein